MRFLLLLPIVVLLSSCASIIKGSSQTVTFQSEPEGAEVIIDGQSRGTTPLTVKLAKNKYDVVTFKKDGYATVNSSLEKKYDAVALLNIFWDLSTTDLISGAAYEYEPNSYFTKLKKKEVEAAADATESTSPEPKAKASNAKKKSTSTED